MGIAKRRAYAPAFAILVFAVRRVPESDGRLVLSISEAAMEETPCPPSINDCPEIHNERKFSNARERMRPFPEK